MRLSNVYSKKLIIEKVFPSFKLKYCYFNLNFLLLLKLKSGIGAQLVDFESVLYFDIRNWTGSNFRIIEIGSITAFKHLIGYLYGNREKMLCDFLKALRSKGKIEEIKRHYFVNLNKYLVDLVSFNCEIGI